VNSIGYIVMIALLAAGAAYGLANKGKPRPTLSSGKQKAAVLCFAVAGGCFLLAAAVGLLAHNAAPH